MMRAGDLLDRLRALPFADFDALSAGGRIMVLAPHPDDESLGCGGLIAEACRRGRPPEVVVLTDGAGSHPASRSYPPARLRAVRAEEARHALAILGLPAGHLHLLGLPDTRLAERADPAVAALVALVRAKGIRSLCAPWRHDPHGDHEAAHGIARAVAAASGARLLSYIVWGWLLAAETMLPEPEPQGWRLDIARHRDAKRRAIAAHASQYGDLITDDPSGFRLPPALLAQFDVPYEVFLAS